MREEVAWADRVSAGSEGGPQAVVGVMHGLGQLFFPAHHVGSTGVGLQVHVAHVGANMSCLQYYSASGRTGVIIGSWTDALFLLVVLCRVRAHDCWRC